MPFQTKPRFAEYFFRAGLKPDVKLDKSKLAKNIIPDVYTKEEEKDPHPLTYHYDASTIYRYPPNDYSKDEKFPAYTPMFCFPHDVQFFTGESKKPQDSFHSFVLTI
jgi:hypothetical protein